MPTQDTDVVKIKGLIPALDARVVQPMFVLEGTNFFVDLRGPKAWFGNRFVTYEQMTDKYFVKSFRYNQITYLCTDNGVYVYDTQMAGYSPIYLFDGSAGTGPWSFAEVGGLPHFCRNGVGVFQYDPDTLTITVIDDLPSLAVAITQSFDRLIVLCEADILWTKQGDGTDTAASLATGAGSQTLANYMRGQSQMVFEVEDGFISFTTAGVLKSELTEIGSTFRHFPLSRTHHAINAFAIVQMENYNCCFIDEKGLFETDGRKRPEPFQPLMGEYLSREVFANSDLAGIATFSLFYSIPHKMLFVSFGISGDDGAYSNALVYYQPRDEWGSFNSLHYGFGELALDEGALKGFNFGYIGTYGYIHKFDDFAYRETPPLGAAGEYLFQQWGEFVARKVDDVWYLPCLMYETPDEVVFLDQDLGSGMYSYTSATDADQESEDWLIASPDEDWLTDSGNEDWNAGLFPGTWTAEIYSINKESLSARIKVGLYHLDMQQFDDEISQVSDVALGMSPNYLTEDWMNGDSTEDWLTLSGDEDWGLDLIASMVYDFNWIGSDDGSASRTLQLETPYLHYDSGATQFYKVDILGKYHAFELLATEVDETFHLKSLEITGTVAGRAG